jgi:hypothetical protein
VPEYVLLLKKNTRPGFSPASIGSQFTAGAVSINNHARFAGLWLDEFIVEKLMTEILFRWSALWIYGLVAALACLRVLAAVEPLVPVSCRETLDVHFANIEHDPSGVHIEELCRRWERKYPELEFALGLRELLGCYLAFEKEITAED